MSKKQGEVIVETGMDNSKFVKGVNELKNIVERLTNSLGKSSNKTVFFTGIFWWRYKAGGSRI